MADQTSPSGGGVKLEEKKATVRITLPPRPMAPGAGAQAPTQPAPAIPAQPAGTVPAIPVPSKKQTTTLKKTTGKLPGATKPAMPVVPPPTVRAQTVPQAPTTVAAEKAPPQQQGATVPLGPAGRPTVKLQAADISATRPPTFTGPAPSAPAPVSEKPSGPTLLDAVLSLIVAVVYGVTAWLMYGVLTM